jgi:hypothetical protein
MIRFALTAILMLSASAAYAAPDAPTETIIRLTPAQIAAIEDAKIARESAPPVLVETDTAKTPREVHGEVGFGVGTRGYSEVFGTIVTPLGDNGVAAFSFARQSYGRRRARR